MGSIRRTLVCAGRGSSRDLAMAAPAHAGLLVETAQNCDDLTSAKVFRPWLDLANYVPAPGGMSSPTAGWTLKGGARVVAGNEPWKVGGSDHESSLLLPAGSSATTGAMCVGIGHPTMRFFAKREQRAALDACWSRSCSTGLGGTLKSLPIGVVLGGTEWQPTLPYPVVASLLPLLPGQQTPVAFRFTPILGGAGRSTTCTSIRSRHASRVQAAGTCCVMQWTPPPPSASVSPGTRDGLAARVERPEQRERLGVGLLRRASGRSAPPLQR